MTVPVALIATASSLALVAAIVFAMRMRKAPENTDRNLSDLSDEDEDLSENNSIINAVRSEPVSAKDYKGSTRYQFSAQHRNNSGGKRKSKRKYQNRKSKRKYSKKV